MKKLGFGMMRLPMIEKEVDTEQVCRMVDKFLEEGFNYFDTAHGYISGKSQLAVKACLTSRYPRDKFILTNKLTSNYFKTKEDIRPLFESQLEACGVDYFDYYLMHALDAEEHENYKKNGAYETALELKAEGKIRHMGISFHDTADVLEKILTEVPEIEVVQIQFNYVDFESPSVESKKCYEVCRKFGKPVLIMEQVKGGSLVKLPEKAKEVFSEVGGGSPASYAIRFAASFEGVLMVLSGMSDMEQMEDNISFMKDFKPFSEEEFAAVKKVCDIFRAQKLIPCTACHYCTDGCPRQIPIPDIFACMNQRKCFGDWNSNWYYGKLTENGGKASECIKCGKCEKSCPQHLKIRELLEQCAAEFEKKE